MSSSKLPLQGTSVLVSRPEHQSKELVDKLTASGAEVLAIPAIEIKPPHSWEQIDCELQRLESFDVIVFTSANGVQYFMDRLAHLTQKSVIPESVTIVSIGPATAKRLESFCVKADIMPQRYISDDIAETLGDVKGKRILLPRADIARKQLALDLQQREAEVVEIPMYRVGTNSDASWVEKIRQMPETKAPDYITVTSSSTAVGISDILREGKKSHWLASGRFICIGPITAKTVEDLGFTPHVIADVFTTDGIFKALMKEKQNV